MRSSWLAGMGDSGGGELEHCGLRGGPRWARHCTGERRAAQSRLARPEEALRRRCTEEARERRSVTAALRHLYVASLSHP